MYEKIIIVIIILDCLLVYGRRILVVDAAVRGSSAVCLYLMYSWAETQLKKQFSRTRIQIHQISTLKLAVLAQSPFG